MIFEYNLTAIGVDPVFPDLIGGTCSGLDCEHPGVEVAFTQPVSLEYLGYYVKESTEIEVGDYLMNALSLNAILLIIFAGVFVSCLLHLFTKLLTNITYSVSSFGYFALAGFFKNSDFDPKKPFCSRVLFCAWLLFAFTLTEHYGARLRSVLLLTHYRGAIFENLDEAMDAMEYQGWKMVLNDTDYSPFIYCKDAQCARLQKLRERSLILETNASLEAAVETDHHFGFGGLQMHRVPYERNVIDDAKRILFVRDRALFPVFLSYALRKQETVLLEKLNRVIEITNTRYSTIFGRYARPFRQYVDKQLQRNAQVLTLRQLMVLLKWTGGLFLISVACFLGEVLYSRYGQSYLRRFQETQHCFSLDSSFNEIQSDIKLTSFSNLAE